jgi:hypothetical protein
LHLAHTSRDLEVDMQSRMLGALALAVAACGGTEPPPSPQQPSTPSTPSTTQFRVHSTGLATVVKNGVTESGTVDVVAYSNPGHPSRLTLSSTTLAGTHFFTGGVLTFADPAAPAVGTYTAADAGPGTVFRSEDGGDIYDSNHGGGLVSLVVTEATPASVHGTLTFNVKFAGTTVATF